MSALAFLDTETTSLRPDRRCWEVGLVVRESGHAEQAERWFIEADDLDLGNADLISLNVGRFYERHPQCSGNDSDHLSSERFVMSRIERLTRGAHLVGAVVSFDADVLGQRMRANGLCPSWHYHLIDVEALAVGYLQGRAQYLYADPFLAGDAAVHRDQATESARLQLMQVASPPWKSDDLSAALGVTISEEDRHTALGDARWAMRIYDAVMGNSS